MFGGNINNLLPSDDELVRRDNVFLKLFDKYSIDEGDDPELADFDSPDEMENDDNASDGPSFSETSDREGDDDDDDGDNSAMDDITKQLQPVIQERVNAWPKKGVNLQLRKVDPSVSVDEWIKANQALTTTTKEYKKTVVQEENKTITTTTKRTKTTTKTATFNAFAPRLMAVKANDDRYPREIIEEITEKYPMDKGKSNIQQTLAKNDVKRLPVTIQLSKLTDLSFIDRPTTSTKSKQPTKSKRQYEQRANKENASTLADRSTIDKAKRKVDPPATRKYQKRADKDEPEATKMESTVIPSDIGTNTRCLRSRTKENIVSQIRNDENKRPPKVTKKTSKTKTNRIESPLDEQLRNDSVHTEPIHCSRSPLKERAVNRRNSQRKLRGELWGQVEKKKPSQTPPKVTKKATKAEHNRIESPSYEPLRADSVHTEPIHRSRSPLKERELNRREPQRKLRGASQVEKEKPSQKPPKVTKKTSKTEHNRIESPSYEPLRADSVHTEPIHRSRSPLKEKELNRREPQRKLRGALQVEKEKPSQKPSKVTKKTTKVEHNRIESPSYEPQRADSVHTEPIHRSRSPLKEREVNRRATQRKLRIVSQVQKEKPSEATKKNGKKQQHPVESLAIDTVPSESFHRPPRSALKELEVNGSEPMPKLRALRVNINKLPCSKVTTRRSARIQKQSVEEMSLIEHTEPNVNSMSLSHYDPPTTIDSNFDVQTLPVQKRFGKKSSQPKPPQQQRIVIYSPSSDTLLGTKINDTTMLVRKCDYRKRINAKHLRKTTVFDRSIIPINRQVIYQPPLNDTNNDNTDNDSECEDVLLSSYMNTGRIVQMVQRCCRNEN